jgi:hypothetical protein
MTAAAEGGNIRFFRGAEKAPSRTHGIDRVLRVSSMAVIAEDAVCGMDAVAPELYRLAQPAGLAAVAADADNFLLRRCIGGSTQAGHPHYKENQAQTGKWLIHLSSLLIHE